MTNTTIEQAPAERALACCIFTNKESTTPSKSGKVSWSDICRLHKIRNIRLDKNGQMIGCYALKSGGKRRNSDVLYRSSLLLDIDTVGVKENNGRIIEVTKKAPALDEIRAAIDEFEYVAVSTHWHEPHRGVIKYRVIILQDRDISEREYKALLEALDKILGKVLDRGAWQWSQAFFLPSCPEENEQYAFYEHNEGIPLPVDEFVKRGREIVGERGKRHSSPVADALGEDHREYPPQDAESVADSCAVFRKMRETRGANQSEPEWYKALGVLALTKQGARVCHEYSSEYEGYNEDQCQTKIDHVQKFGKPTTCETFDALGLGFCDDCEHRGKIISPIQLGVDDTARVEHAQAEANKAIEQVAAADKGAITLPSPHYDYVQAGSGIFTRIAEKQDMFFRGGQVVTLAPVGLEVLKPEGFVSLLDAYGTVMKHITTRNGESVLAARRCSMDTAKVLLASKEARKLLPNIRTVAQRPVMSLEGKTLEKGYHPDQGGVYVLSGEQIPEVPVEVAVAGLKELLCDFDFISPGDMSRAAAALVSPAMAMAGVFDTPPPVDFAEADQSQSGKTYRHELVREIYGEKTPPVAQKKGGVGSVDESLASRLVAGSPFISYDNFRGHFDSPMLEHILTCAGPVAARVPHKGEVEVDARGVTIQLSSNGLLSSPDLANRAVITRIAKRPSEYQYRRWPEGDTKDHITANQAWYLGCVFSVVRVWIRHERPGIPCKHDRRNWAYPMNWIVQELFGLDALMEGHAAAKSRLCDPGAGWLRQLALRLEVLGSFGEIFTTSELAEFAIEEGVRVPGAMDRFNIDVYQLARRIGSIMRQTFSADAVKRTVDAQGLAEETLQVDRITIARAEIYEQTLGIGGATVGKSRRKKTWIYAFAGV